MTAYKTPTVQTIAIQVAGGHMFGVTRSKPVRFLKPKSNGYCEIWLGRPSRPYWLHHIMHDMVHGAPPPGMHRDHICRVTACCNPECLHTLTPKENYLRGVGFGAANARKTACSAGHEFTEASTYRDPRGRRRCRLCREGYARSYKAAHRERYNAWQRARRALLGGAPPHPL